MLEVNDENKKYMLITRSRNPKIMLNYNLQYTFENVHMLNYLYSQKPLGKQKHTKS